LGGVGGAEADEEDEEVEQEVGHGQRHESSRARRR
jgi:hypothetical protein